MFVFVIIIVVSIIGLAIIGTNNNMHNDPKLIAAWGLGNVNHNSIRKVYVMIFLEIISWMVIIVSGIYFVKGFQLQTYDMDTGEVVKVIEKPRFSFAHWIGTKE
jgi:hypothetical protein